MRVFDRYFFREMSIPFAFGIALFFIIIAFAQVIEISDSATGLGIDGRQVFQLILYSLPPLLGLLIPISALFAALLATSRLAGDRELIAFAAGGGNIYTLLRVPLVFGLLGTIASALLLTYGEPYGIKGLRRLMAESAQSAIAKDLPESEFQEWVPGLVLRVDSATGFDLKGIFLGDRRRPNRPLTLSAERGKIRPTDKAGILRFDFEDGQIVLEGDPQSKEPAMNRIIDFETAQYRIDLGRLVTHKAKTLVPAQELSNTELRVWISEQKKFSSEKARRIIILHRRLAMPLATLIFCLMAVPLGLSGLGGARARSFLYCAVIASSYYFVSRALELSARKGKFDPVLAAWTPDLIGIALLVLLLIIMKRKRLG